ncbi:sugar phosphate isomerase/epimerase family protein [Streptomyces violens]|uniref:sugar phosphate isomerase/epimerase family protein n=1 Tax=Streptomyces violens TaxID=66377 RepID=UPI0004C13671|nr:sugar phosphate isomerase/epimerase [Streptomyces violens]
MYSAHGKSAGRRRFLRGAVASAAALTVGSYASPAFGAPSAGAAGRRIPTERIGFQLYTVRDMLAADPEGTLAMVAEAGYAEIEPAYTYGGRTAAQFHRIAEANGLRVIGSHHAPDDFRGARAQQTFDNALALGQQYVGVSYMDGPQTAEGYRAMAREMNRWGEAARSHGLRWYAHLHDNEFHTDPQSGRPLFDVWLAETDPDLVWFEMDLYWILRAGVDPAPYLRSYEKRFPMLHIKDGVPREGVETDLGEGTVDFPGILAHLRSLPHHHYVIERDEQPDPVRTAHVSYDYFRALRVPPPGRA